MCIYNDCIFYYMSKCKNMEVELVGLLYIKIIVGLCLILV